MRCYASLTLGTNRCAKVERMKISAIVVIFLLLPLELFAQSKYVGEYYDHFGSNLKLKPDTTFEHTWRFDLSSSWTKGTWKVSNDTIYLNIKPVYDTLLVKNNGSVVDSLVLSLDSKAESISMEEYAIGTVTSGGQNRHTIPTKLYYSRNKLIEVDEHGKLKRKRVRDLWRKKHVPWYIKREEK